MSNISFGETNNINDIHNEIKQMSKSVSAMIKSKRDEFQISLATVSWHDETYNKYKLVLLKEGIIVEDAILLLEPLYYDLVGYPEIGDLVKILHQNNRFNIYILGRCNSPTKEMVGKNTSGIPAGVYMP